MNDRSSILNVDKEHQQITLIVNTLYHNILRPYIAHANEREVIEGLFDFFKKYGKNTTGIKGVSAGKDGKFRVYICLGTFNSKEEAKNVYDEAAKKIYGEFYRA